VVVLRGLIRKKDELRSVRVLVLSIEQKIELCGYDLYLLSLLNYIFSLYR